MADGSMHKFLDKVFGGDVVYTCVFPQKVLGGLTLSRETIPLDLVPPPNAELEYSLLEIGVLTPHTSVEWRVKVNGINVTKEFKPLSTSKIGDKLFAKLVYDITSILKTPESLKRKRVNVTFKREGGEPLTIEHIGIIALFSSGEAKSLVKYYSGASSIEPGEKTSLDLGLSGEALLRTALYMPSRSAVVELLVSGKNFAEITNIQGMSEEIHRLTGFNEVDRIEYHHVDTGEKYSPKEIGLSNLLVYRVEYAKPELVLEELKIPSEVEGEVRAKLRISNRGLSKPDKALIVVMSRGEVLVSKGLEPIEPGHETEAEVVIKQPPGEYQLVFRIIWRKLSQTWYREERVNVKFK